jgi:hypothetical protein
MNTLLPKVTRFNPDFLFQISLNGFLVAMSLYFIWEQRSWSAAVLLALILIVGGKHCRVARLRRKPKLLSPTKARLEPKTDRYKEIDSLLTEMEIPYYQYRQIQNTNTRRQVEKQTA